MNSTTSNTDATFGLEQSLTTAVRRRIGENRYQLWFHTHTRFAVDGDQVIVRVPNAHFQEWLSSTFGSDVRDAVLEVTGRPLPVRYVIDVAAVAETPIAPAAPVVTQRNVETEVAAERTLANADVTQPTRTFKSGRRWHSLQDFVVGACNRVAHASAISVVEEPCQGANPLVLHGPVGIGKTHLLEGIYTGLRKQWPDAKVTYITAEDFTNRFVQAMRLGKIGSFRKQFREVGALLLDNLNFLATKKATQEEFLHTFDVLMADGRQVVVTTDCHPRMSDELLPELVDRLLGGAVWGLMPPDEETRLNILRAKTVTGTPGIPENVLKFLAHQLRGNVRELEGAMHSLRHFSKVSGKVVDLGMAREALGELLRHAVRLIQTHDVDTAVCSVLRLPTGALQSQNRSWSVSHPRMLAIYLSRKHTSATYSEISKHFGGKTHSAAVAAEKKVRQWLQNEECLILGDREWRAKDLIERIERELQK